MQFIKSLIFNIFLYFGLISIFILAIPTLILPDKFTIFFGRISAKYIVLILKLVMNTKVIFHGEENLKKVDNFFVIHSQLKKKDEVNPTPVGGGGRFPPPLPKNGNYS